MGNIFYRRNVSKLTINNIILRRIVTVQPIAQLSSDSLIRINGSCLCMSGVLWSTSSENYVVSCCKDGVMVPGQLGRARQSTQ